MDGMCKVPLLCSSICTFLDLYRNQPIEAPPRVCAARKRVSAAAVCLFCVAAAARLLRSAEESRRRRQHEAERDVAQRTAGATRNFRRCDA